MSEAARLPNVERAIVEDAKLLDYLLDANHPRGGPKADFLGRFGYGRHNADVLREALLDHARDNDVVATSEMTDFGVSYIVEGVLRTPDGRNPIIRTIWMIDIDAAVPRLITLTPRGRRPNQRRAP